MSKEYWANLILGGLLSVLAIIAVTKIGTALTPKGLFVGESEPSKVAASLLNEVRLTQYGFLQEKNHKVRADFYIRNSSEQDVKNINIKCALYDENGSYQKDENWILYRTFPGGKEAKYSSAADRFMQIRGPVDCQVSDLQLVKEPFFKLHRSGGHGEAEAGAGEHVQPENSGH